jgi:hypothetical protein
MYLVRRVVPVGESVEATGLSGMLYRGVGRARASVLSVSSVDGVGGWQWDEFAGTTICGELANRLRWYPNARAFVDVRR